MDLLPKKPTQAIPIVYERLKVNYNHAIEDKNE